MTMPLLWFDTIGRPGIYTRVDFEATEMLLLTFKGSTQVPDPFPRIQHGIHSLAAHIKLPLLRARVRSGVIDTMRHLGSFTSERHCWTTRSPPARP